MQDPRDVVLHEFVSYYNADELPFVVEGGLDDQATDSGRRFVHVLGDRAREAVALLQGVVADREGPLLEELDRRTMYAWNGTEEDWQLFCRIVTRIEETVESELASA